MSLNVSDDAPNFSLPDAAGHSISLKDFLGQWVILYFYPKDMTSGCTQQACDFRDAFPDFSSLKSVVLGVSADTLKMHQNFRDKYQLPFHLLSDADHKTCESYGVWVEKSMYGRKYFGIERSTFLIRPDGRIAALWRKVKVPGHISTVLNTLKELK